MVSVFCFDHFMDFMDLYSVIYLLIYLFNYLFVCLFI